MRRLGSGILKVMNEKLRPSAAFSLCMLFFMVACGAVMARPAHAQTIAGPQFMITWSTDQSEIPSFYTGKSLPSYGNYVTAEVTLLVNGRPVDLSGQTIYWYLNDVLIGGGTGVQKLTFLPFGTPPGSMTLKVDLPGYGGQDLSHETFLPFVTPVAVIMAPYPGGSFSTNPVAVSALPYFFDASSSALSYSWAVNGQTGTNAENPQSAEITLPQNAPSGSSLTITLGVTNPQNHESANTQSTLTYSSQL